jgi:hypothetical protein
VFVLYRLCEKETATHNKSKYVNIKDGLVLALGLLPVQSGRRASDASESTKVEGAGTVEKVCVRHWLEMMANPNVCRMERKHEQPVSFYSQFARSTMAIAGQCCCCLEE